MAFYDGTKLLSLKDINGENPEIFICTSNRNGGKTTYFGRYVVNRFLKYGEKFMLIYRYGYELCDIHEKFFKELQRLFFNDYVMTSKSRSKDVYVELYLNDKPCGYAIALNKAEQIKKLSHFFADTTRMLFDEFQPETGVYCANEVQKLMSVHTSVARGGGKQVRYVPLIMCGNPYTMLNPYYADMGISERLTDDVKFLRGNGFVLEQGYVESAARAQAESGFMRAFEGNAYHDYAVEGVYLNDNKAFIEKPKSKGKYMATIRCDGTDYAIRQYPEEGIIYCDDRADSSFPMKIAVTTEDHNINYVMLQNNTVFIYNMRFYFQQGCFRFKDLRCKRAIIKLLAIR
ncbi:MAG: phage DNA encapsidation protein [Methanobrevibacter sp.]|nr:phage DNA encapsidation protein [Methanobrevibacter sp.]